MSAKSTVKDSLLIGGILGVILLVICLIIGSAVFEIFKAIAVIKYVFS